MSVVIYLLLTVAVFAALGLTPAQSLKAGGDPDLSSSGSDLAKVDQTLR